MAHYVPSSVIEVSGTSVNKTEKKNSSQNLHFDGWVQKIKIDNYLVYYEVISAMEKNNASGG